MKKILIVVLFSALFLAASCSTTFPVDATSNPVGTKVGEATGIYLFNFIPLFGADSGIRRAARNGNISLISTVDQRATFYWFWTSVTTVVTGE
ncbi:MAG: TRL domain-containing protein [Candidatus Ornithospirochaeta sp.]